MDIDLNTIESGPTRALLFFDNMFEALYEDKVSSVDRVKFNYYIRPYREAREQGLPREPEKQYQVLLQLKDSKGFSVEQGLTDLKPGSKVLITVLDTDLFMDSYNLSIQQRHAMLTNLDPVVKATNDKRFNDMLENTAKKSSKLKASFGDDPRITYKGKSKTLRPGTKIYEILKYLSRNKNHPEDVRTFKNVVNESITNNRHISGFRDVYFAINSLRKDLKVKSDDGFPIICDGYTQTVTWSEPK